MRSTFNCCKARLGFHLWFSKNHLISLSSLFLFFWFLWAFVNTARSVRKSQKYRHSQIKLHFKKQKHCGRSSKVKTSWCDFFGLVQNTSWKFFMTYLSPTSVSDIWKWMQEKQKKSDWNLLWNEPSSSILPGNCWCNENKGSSNKKTQQAWTSTSSKYGQSLTRWQIYKRSKPISKQITENMCNITHLIWVFRYKWAQSAAVVPGAQDLNHEAGIRGGPRARSEAEDVLHVVGGDGDIGWCWEENADCCRRMERTDNFKKKDSSGRRSWSLRTFCKEIWS